MIEDSIGGSTSVLQEMQDREKKTYSIRQALLSAKANSSGEHVPGGFEGEVSAEIARRTGRKPSGWFVPHAATVEGRANDTTTTGAGAVQTVWPGQFVDVLRSKLVVAALGGQITTLSTEKGQVQLPVQTQQHASTWVTEGNAAVSNTSLAVSSVTFVPHTILVNTGISRFMEDNAAPGFIAWLYEDLAKSIAVSVDQAAIAGTSANNQPIGLLSTAGVPVYTLAADTGNGGAPSYADLVGMELAAGLNNADSEASASLGWLTSPAGRSKLRRTDSSNLDSGTSGQWAWDKNHNTVLGYRALSTTNCPANLTKGTGTGLSPLIFGNWPDLVVNLFDAVDLVFNPFTITISGFYGLYAYQEVDVAVRRTGAFQVVNAMVTT